jgi:hypothetical protein
MSKPHWMLDSFIRELGKAFDVFSARIGSQPQLGYLIDVNRVSFAASTTGPRAD